MDSASFRKKGFFTRLPLSPTRSDEIFPGELPSHRQRENCRPRRFTYTLFAEKPSHGRPIPNVRVRIRYYCFPSEMCSAGCSYLFRAYPVRYKIEIKSHGKTIPTARLKRFYWIFFYARHLLTCCVCVYAAKVKINISIGNRQIIVAAAEGLTVVRGSSNRYYYYVRDTTAPTYSRQRNVQMQCCVKTKTVSNNRPA